MDDLTHLPIDPHVQFLKHRADAASREGRHEAAAMYLAIAKRLVEGVSQNRLELDRG